ncbi:MAG: hypothetical protein E6J90_32985 [Deltaproteobacteria bacterium]|nr:MAG: hypothetical protein E6J90_32985 [Deltaproteobacteria bacterium]
MRNDAAEIDFADQSANWPIGTRNITLQERTFRYPRCDTKTRLRNQDVHAQGFLDRVLPRRLWQVADEDWSSRRSRHPCTMTSSAVLMPSVMSVMWVRV